MAPQALNTNQARVINPILSTHALGYRKTDVSMAGRLLFPVASIPQRGAKIIKFDKRAWRRYQTRRAPGANTKRVSFGFDAGDVTLVQDALEGMVPIEHLEEAQAVPGIDLGMGAVDMVMDVILSGEEARQAAVALDPANYDANHKVTLSGTDMWDDPASKPGEQIRSYAQAIRSATGRRPNTLIIPPNAFDALAENPEIKDRFKYTSAESLTTAMLARYFSLDQVAVGDDVYLPENAADSDPAVDVWGNAAVLAYVSKGSNYMVPSYGYTYMRPGHPFVTAPYFDDNAKSWFYPVTHETQVVQSAPGAGFLIENPVA